jgi:5-formyltetrahydrofolate cyclo-ligase
VTKKELRQELRRRMADIPPQELAERSVIACGRLVEQPEYRRAEIVMIFLSTPKEIDTSHVALNCWSNLKRVLAPKVSWEQRRMLPIEIKSLTTDVRTGVMGIREPVEGMPIPVADIDLVIVPGLGFDAAGNRLGRGRGFYDGFLSHRDFQGVSCALALEQQVVPRVPSDETDVRVHMLVTDARVRRFKR